MGFTLVACNDGSTPSGSNSSSITSAKSDAIAGSSINSQLSAGAVTSENQQYKIFVTKAAFSGNFPLAAANSGGGNALTSTQAADYLCNHNVPSDVDASKKYKALIGSSKRSACDVNNNCGAGYSTDWPLMSNTEYLNTDEDLIFKTNNVAKFTFNNLSNYFSSQDTNVWTGLTDDWAVNDNTCSDWRSGSSGKSCRVGYTKTTTANSISDKQTSCDKARPLYCVQQPDITVNPVDGELAAPLSTSITVNYSEAIDPSTVNNQTVTLSAESGTSLDGNIEISSDHKTLTFQPLANLSGQTTYNVKVVTIKYANGAIAADVVSKFTTEALGLLIFTSFNNYYGGGIHSKSAADNICNKDSRSGLVKIGDHHGTYKAMLMFNSPDVHRYACSDGVCGGINSMDWVLRPNQSYVNTSGQLIGTTTGQAIFNSGTKLENAIFPSVKRVWTGLSPDWSSSENNCANWTKFDKTGSVGTTYDYETTTGNILHTDVINCGGTGDEVDSASRSHLYCVEQLEKLN